MLPLRLFELVTSQKSRYFIQADSQYRETMHLKAYPDVVYAQLKFMWANEAQDESVKYLRSFASSLIHDLQTETAAVASRRRATYAHMR